MTDENKNNLTHHELAQSHIKDLIRDGKIEYKVFTHFENMKTPSKDLEEIRKALIKIVDINSIEELNQGEGIYQTAKALFEKKNDEMLLLFKIWLGCIEESKPNRKLMKINISEFSSMIDDLSKIHQKYIDFFPALFKFYKKRAFQIIIVLANTLKNEIPSEQVGELLELLTTYMPKTTHKVFSALIPIISAISTIDTETKQEFVRQLSPKVLEENSDARKFVIDLGNSLKKFPQKYRMRVIRLNLLITPKSFSSASYVVKHLDNKLKIIPKEFHEKYIDSFIQIIDKIGIIMIDLCINKLPHFFSSQHSEIVLRYIDTLITISTSYGFKASFDYYKKTKYGKEFIDIFH